MTVSDTKRIGIKKYQQEKCDRITADIPKGKRDAYKMIAAEKGLSLSQLIQSGVESFAQNHGGEVQTKTAPAADDKLPAEQRRLVEEFNRLPSNARRQLVKFLQSLNAGNHDAK